ALPVSDRSQTPVDSVPLSPHVRKNRLALREQLPLGSNRPAFAKGDPPLQRGPKCDLERSLPVRAGRGDKDGCAAEAMNFQGNGLSSAILRKSHNRIVVRNLQPRTVTVDQTQIVLEGMTRIGYGQGRAGSLIRKVLRNQSA